MCDIGYYGEFCNLTCPPGLFGVGCGGECLPMCSVENCHHVHGCKVYVTTVKSTKEGKTTPNDGWYIKNIHFFVKQIKKPKLK